MKRRIAILLFLAMAWPLGAGAQATVVLFRIFGATESARVAIFDGEMAER